MITKQKYFVLLGKLKIFTLLRSLCSLFAKVTAITSNQADIFTLSTRCHDNGN